MDNAESRPAPRDITESMRDYYARRAPVYERVYHRPERQADLRAMAAMLPPMFSGRRVLEIACGTGWWTADAARDALDWLATDLEPEPLAVARAKTMPASVRFASVDAYTLAGLDSQRFDAVFAGCWWSHVPLARLPGWLARLHEQLLPGARVVMLDNRFVAGHSTAISRRDAAGNSYQLRTLDDGSQHEVLKNFPSADEALDAIAAAAALTPDRCVQDAAWTAFEHYWVLDYTLAGTHANKPADKPV